MKVASVANVGQPASLPKEKWTGSKTTRGHRQKSKRRTDEPKQVIDDEPKARTDDDTLIYVKKAKM